MKRNILQTTILSTCLASAAVPSYGFDLFGLFEKKNSLNAMLEHVPNDSLLLVAAAETNDDMVEEVDKWMKNNVLYSSNPYKDLFLDLDNTPGVLLLKWLIDDYYSMTSKGLTELNQHYGIQEDGASIFYTDGLYPVARFALTEEQSIPSLLAKAAKESDYELAQQTINGESVYTFPLIEEGDIQLTLAILVKDKTFTATLFTQEDDDAAKAARLALTEIEKPKAPANWKADGKAYKLDKYLRGYVNFVEIAKAIVQPDSRTHQQLSALLDDKQSTLDDRLGQQCQQDIIGLVSQSPRLVFGSQKQQISDGKINADFTGILELTNSELKTNLSKLRGFLPNYINNNDDDLGFGFAIALDVDQLAPVATQLWTQFTQMEFNCDVLQNVQESAKDLNPSIIGMGTAMMQGTSGISLGVFDVTPDDSNPLGLGIDALMSLTAKKPQVLASMGTQFVPFLNGIIIPDDGTAVSLKSDAFPLDLYVANKGQHLVVYSGEKATATATALLDESPEANGIAAMKFDYTLIGDTIIRSAKSIMNSPVGKGSCVDLYSTGLTFQNIPITLSGRSDITENGIEDTYHLYIDMAKAAQMNGRVGGSYQLEYLEDDCSWVTIGTDQLNDDNTGIYYEMDDTDSCHAYENEYTWTDTLSFMNQTITTDRSREDCDSEWVDDEPGEFSCQILGKSENGFYCLSNDYDEKTLYRYTRQ